MHQENHRRPVYVVEHLFKQSDLTLNATITICRAQEGTKKQHSEMNSVNPGVVLAVRQPQPQPTVQPCKDMIQITCQRSSTLPAYQQICHHCNKMGQCMPGKES